MFVDASVIVAVINREPGWEALARRLEQATPFFSQLSRFEAVLAVTRASTEITGRRATSSTVEKARDKVDSILDILGAKNVDIGVEIGDRALAASARYGKIVGHPARLNLGDCFAYACAKSLKVPLLYKGDDFASTDLG